MTFGDGMITEPDVRAAQVTLDAWLADSVESLGSYAAPDVVVDPPALQRLRGILAAQFAAVRHAGYLEGEQRGRRIAAAVVRDALEGEGL
jgi:hypothetical protein